MKTNEKEFITIKIRRNRYRKVFLDDILYCKAERAYSTIITKNAEYTFCEPLKNVEPLFEFEDNFVRINKSYIVNLTLWESICNSSVRLNNNI
jgi:DNA-binding LytR/AlgR family response regulator